MFDGGESSRGPVGSGYAQMRQVISEIADNVAKRKMQPVTMATVIRDGVIVLDSDGYEIDASSGSIINLAGQHYSDGDRIYVIAMDRQQVLVLGRANPIQSFYPSHVSVPVTTGNGILTPMDPGGDPTAQVMTSFVLSQPTLQPSAPVRLRGRVTRLSGNGAATLTVADEANGTVYSNNFGAGGDFDIELLWINIGLDPLNLITMTLSYDDAQNGEASLSRVVLLIGSP